MHGDARTGTCAMPAETDRAFKTHPPFARCHFSSPNLPPPTHFDEFDLPFCVFLRPSKPQPTMAEHPAEPNQIPPNEFHNAAHENDPWLQHPPAPNPDEADPILQNAPNAPSRLSRVWTYFVNHLSEFWPPIPSRIASNVVFRPPLPSYDIVEVNGRDTLQLNPDVPNQLTEEQRLQMDVFTAESRSNNTIVCMFIPFRHPRFTLFISHGHDVDIGLRASFYHRLSVNLECNVLAYDYSGYGRSTGNASEANMYKDADAALIALVDRSGMTEQQIVFYGHALGTAAAIELATRFPAAAGLILIAPFKSGLRVFFPDMPFTCCFDCFPNINRMKNVMCRTQVIEPMNDELFGPSSGHADAICARARRSGEVVQIEGGYNEIEDSDDCMAYLHHFITKEAGPLPPSNWVD